MMYQHSFRVLKNRSSLIFSWCVLRWVGIGLTLVSSTSSTTHLLNIIYSGSLCLGALMTHYLVPPAVSTDIYYLFISTIITVLQLGSATFLIHFNCSSTSSTSMEDAKEANTGEHDLQRAKFAKLWTYILCLDSSKYLTFVRISQLGTYQFLPSIKIYRFLFNAKVNVWKIWVSSCKVQISIVFLFNKNLIGNNNCFPLIHVCVAKKKINFDFRIGENFKINGLSQFQKLQNIVANLKCKKNCLFADLYEEWELVMTFLYFASGILFWSYVSFEKSPKTIKFMLLFIASMMAVLDLLFPFLSFLPM